MKTVGLPAVPTQFLRSASAPPERTLVDILRHTATTHPEAAAIDDGTTVITYSELVDTLDAAVADLYEQGIRRGDRIGIRLPSGSHELYIAILSVLAAGAAYVPVDVDDPDERATLVFGEADVTATITSAGLDLRRTRSRGDAGPPLPHDDAWIIFTSGSTGTPKGVAVTHRSAAAFVDAEATLFCQDSPLCPDDRVLAGLSIAFDASCEEMWLAWRHGACLVPAPRSLVRSGMDLGPWLIRRNITVVSTVPTLASLWPAEALDQVRARRNWFSGYPRRAVRCGILTVPRRRPSCPALPHYNLVKQYPLGYRCRGGISRSSIRTEIQWSSGRPGSWSLVAWGWRVTWTRTKIAPRTRRFQPSDGSELTVPATMYAWPRMGCTLWGAWTIR